MKKYIPLALLVLLTIPFVIWMARYYRFPSPHERLKPSPVKFQPLVLEAFEPGARPSRNSGTWVKRNGVMDADRISHEDSNTSLRLAFEVREDGGKFKEAGWWCALAGLDMRPYAALHFRMASSDRHILFLIGFKNTDGLEQKIWIEGYAKRSTPAGQWQEITIPLHDFFNMDDWSSMDNFSVTFRTGVGNVALGEVSFDDFTLIPGRAKPMALAAPAAMAPYPLPRQPAALPKDQLLELVQRPAFQYFVNEANPANGLVKDFCRVWTKDHLPVASTAAVGFGLTSMCVGASRGWITDDVAKQRVLATLKFFQDSAEEEHGFFYHFLDMQTGRRWEESELSSVDTSLLVAGMLTAANYWPGTEIEKIAREIYARVDWQWMMASGKTLCMGWTPEGGFLAARWNDYCEAMIIYLLAIGSPTHAIPAQSWYQWSRLRNTYAKETFIACPPLFTHQYSHIWVDFRGMKDEEADYFENSAAATRANHAWCAARKEKFRTYREGFWGLTASDGPTGYMAYGAPLGVDDGTVAPTGAIGSIVFTPEESIGMMRLMLGKLRDKVWGRYGFIDAFNLERRWFSNKYLGIDEGPIVLMIENYRSGLVWKTFMKEPAIQKALLAIPFKKEEATVQ